MSFAEKRMLQALQIGKEKFQIINQTNAVFGNKQIDESVDEEASEVFSVIDTKGKKKRNSAQ